MGNGLGADKDMVFKVADRKRFSNLVRVIGESEADWVDEALERHGIVIPGGGVHRHCIRTVHLSDVSVILHGSYTPNFSATPILRLMIFHATSSSYDPMIVM